MRSRMTLVPKLFSHWWEHLDRPHRLTDQNFAVGLRPEQMIRDFERMSESMFRDFDRRWPSVYNRPWADLMRDENKGFSEIEAGKDKFAVSMDVQQFKPDEINVKIVDNYIVVEGKHEEKQDDHGVISRHFVRKYMIPEQCDPEKAVSNLSADGVLTVVAPRKPEDATAKREKVLKIEHTGKPALENAEEPQKIAQKQ